MYFRQSLIGMVKYKEHGNVLAEDFEDSSMYDEDKDQIYVENLYSPTMQQNPDGSTRPGSAVGFGQKLSRTDQHLQS